MWLIKNNVGAGFTLDDLDPFERQAASIIFSEFEGNVFDFEFNVWKAR